MKGCESESTGLLAAYFVGFGTSAKSTKLTYTLSTKCL